MITLTPHYKIMVKHTNNVERKLEARASSLPFCPIREVLSIRENKKTRGYRAEFYMNIGTVIHNVFQKWFPRSNKSIVFGNWKCDCGELYVNRIGPVTCDVCGSLTTYSEMMIKSPGSIVTGYVDHVVVCYDDMTFWVVELKSGSKFVVTKHKVPKTQHILQSVFVTQMMRKSLSYYYGINNINIKGYIIKYISRDSPAIASKDFSDVVDGDAYYDFTVSYIDLLCRAVVENNPDIIFYARPCEIEFTFPSSFIGCKDVYGDCEWINVCGNKPMFYSNFEEIRDELLKYIYFKGCSSIY
jgi:hypothetical protein